MQSEAVSTNGFDTRSAPLQLGAVSYLNTLPIIDGLSKLRGLQLTLAAPNALGDLLAARELDVALVSAADYQNLDVPFCLLPVGVIASDGPTLTVRVFSRVPLEAIKTVHADVESRTSVVLMQLVLEHLGHGPVELTPFDAQAHKSVAQQWQSPSGLRVDELPQALLLIGDKVMTGAPPAELYPYQLDLGEAWRAWTGLPFVYASWMCPADQMHSERVDMACSLIGRQHKRNEARVRWIAQQHAPAHHWPTDAAVVYAGRILSYSASTRARAGLDRFYKEAAIRGFFKHTREPEWLTRETRKPE